jgi:methylmalonyl-CoA mutase
MQNIDQFFAEFPPVSKAAWLERITKDLKGRALEDLYWHLNQDIIVAPFVHADDQPAPTAPLTAVPNNWAVCEEIPAESSDANTLALDALKYGADALCFRMESQSDLKKALQGIHLDYIGLYFTGSALQANPGAVLALLEKTASESGIKASAISGALAYDPLTYAGMQDWRYLSDLIAHAQAYMPYFRLIGIDGARYHNGAEAVADELAALLRHGNRYMEELTSRGLVPANAAEQIHFDIAIGPSYFVEIAKLRAFRLLWLNMLKAWGAPLREPVVAVHFHPQAYNAELFTNMIRATTMAMSAIIAGACRLTVRPYDAGRENESKYDRAFARRIARNVQHLLKMESFLHEIHDPAAGSYYIEKLTQQIAEEAWRKWSHSS